MEKPQLDYCLTVDLSTVLQISGMLSRTFFGLSFKLQKCTGFDGFKLEKCTPYSLEIRYGRVSQMKMEI